MNSVESSMLNSISDKLDKILEILQILQRKDSPNKAVPASGILPHGVPWVKDMKESMDV